MTSTINVISFEYGRNETDLNTAKQVNKIFIKGTDGSVSVGRDVLLYCVEIDRVVNHFVVVGLTATTTTIITNVVLPATTARATCQLLLPFFNKLELS